MKIKKRILTTGALTLALLTFSCKNQNKEDNTTSNTEEEVVVEVPDIEIQKLTDSPEYKDASLSLNTDKVMEIAEEGEIDFNFTVENYELGAQTAGPNPQILANSGKGQHIHFILDNQPYSAHYEASFKKEIPKGVHHLVAFLSRSYHESVKNDNSVIVRKLVIGDEAEDVLGIDVDTPTLIYSRPKGEYSGKDTESVLLDFFVLNTTLSEDGNKVRVTVNDKEFIVTEWVPYVLKGLPKGEVKLKLELIDNQNNPIDGPFNIVERSITLKE
ncbi:hypothetical protein GTQ40_17185 [Flavobacteriaceae bacterium R38]|nr:hypothetical protein [Flavobacteriaceae bacterium R38]